MTKTARITRQWLKSRGFYVAHQDGTLMSPMVEPGRTRIVIDIDGSWSLWHSKVIGQIPIPAPPRTLDRFRTFCRFHGIGLTLNQRPPR